MPAVSETYLTDHEPPACESPFCVNDIGCMYRCINTGRSHARKDDGSEALLREAAEATREESERARRRAAAALRTVPEGTDLQQRAFAAKMAEWRRTGGVPGYIRPKAAR